MATKAEAVQSEREEHVRLFLYRHGRLRVPIAALARPQIVPHILSETTSTGSSRLLSSIADRVREAGLSTKGIFKRNPNKRVQKNALAAIRKNKLPVLRSMSAVDASYLFKECIELMFPDGILPKAMGPVLEAVVAAHENSESSGQMTSLKLVAGLVLLLPTIRRMTLRLVITFFLDLFDAQAPTKGVSKEQLVVLTSRMLLPSVSSKPTEVLRRGEVCKTVATFLFQLGSEVGVWSERILRAIRDCKEDKPRSRRRSASHAILRARSSSAAALALVVNKLPTPRKRTRLQSMSTSTPGRCATPSRKRPRLSSIANVLPGRSVGRSERKRRSPRLAEKREKTQLCQMQSLDDLWIDIDEMQASPRSTRRIAAPRPMGTSF